MRGLVLEGTGRIALRDDLPDPVLRDPHDAIVAVRRAGLCGSDLHPYEGREPARPGVIAGHEIVGTVVAAGAAVEAHAQGDRVLAAFTTSCGACDACRRGLSARCSNGALFGYGAPDRSAPALDGGQAELIRVPLANHTLVRMPDAVPDVAAVLLTDNLPTAWYALQRAAVPGGEPLVVVGLGAVGLCAVHCAPLLGAGPVIAVDPVADRRERAIALGATSAVAPPDAADAVAQAAPGGATAVVEAAGSAAGQRLAFDLLRPGGTLSVIAVQTAGTFAFTPVEAYDRNLTVRAGRAPVRSLLDDLLPRVAAGDLTLPTQVVITHPDVPLADGPEVYRRFAAREPGLVKAVFAPGY